ncbi:MAG: porin PorA family protein [Mycobacteriales bacterium]
MRNKTATALVGAGVFALALGVLIPTVAAPRLIKAPGEIALTTHSRSEAQKLNTTTQKLETVQVDLTRRLATHRIAGKVAGTDKNGVFDELLELKLVNSDGTLSPSLGTDAQYNGLKAAASVVAFDRKSGKGVPGFRGDTWNTTAQTVKFPFDAKKKTYSYFDQTSGRAFPVSYVRTTTVKGLKVYEYHGTIPQMSLGQYGVLAGTDTIYSNTGRTVLVEPVTGSIVSSTTSPQTSIQFPDGSVVPALLVKELVPTDATVAERVSYAKDKKSQIQLLQRAPWALVILGLLLLGGGLFVQMRRRPAQGAPAARPDVSGALPTPRTEPAARPTHVKH